MNVARAVVFLALAAFTELAKVHDDVRNGLIAMKAKMLSEADRIRAQREKNGLENR